MKKSVRFSDPIEQPCISEQKEITELEESCQHLGKVSETLLRFSAIVKRLIKYADDHWERYDHPTGLEESNEVLYMIRETTIQISTWICEKLLELQTIDITKSKITQVFNVEHTEVMDKLSDIVKLLGDNRLKEDIQSFINKVL